MRPFAPLATLGLCPGPCRPLGVSPVNGTSVSLVSPPLPLYVILGLPSYSGAWYPIGWSFFRAKTRGAGDSTPWQSLAPVPVPTLLLGQAVAFQANPPPPPPSRLDTIPVGKFSGASCYNFYVVVHTVVTIEAACLAKPRSVDVVTCKLNYFPYIYILFIEKLQIISPNCYISKK